MSVDLAKLPADEELVRTGATWNTEYFSAIQNVLDALNWYRCSAKFAEQELTRVKAEQDQ